MLVLEGREHKAGAPEGLGALEAVGCQVPSGSSDLGVGGQDLLGKGWWHLRWVRVGSGVAGGSGQPT